MTPTKQIEAIQKMGHPRTLQRFGGVLVALFVALAAAALYTQQAPYVMALVFVSFVTWSAFQTSPHIEAAARALATANGANGSVTIDVGTTGRTASRTMLSSRWHSLALGDSSSNP